MREARTCVTCIHYDEPGDQEPCYSCLLATTFGDRLPRFEPESEGNG